MQPNEKKNSEYYTIDLLYILKCLWSKAWVIILTAVLGGALGFGLSAHMMKPDYSSKILLYVNNSSFNLGNTSFSISASDISASQSLVNTYKELLLNRTTLNRVINKTDVNYSYAQLREMIEAGSSNNTEIMYVQVTGKDPYEASKIANCIAEVLPMRIAEIIDGASMEVVDYAVPNTMKVGPSVTKYTALFMILGMLAASGVIAVIAMLDDRIHDEDYITETYGYPILAKVPNLLGKNNGNYGSYSYGYSKTEKGGKK